MRNKRQETYIGELTTSDFKRTYEKFCKKEYKIKDEVKEVLKTFTNETKKVKILNKSYYIVGTQKLVVIE